MKKSLQSIKNTSIKPYVRILVLIIGLIAMLVLSYWLTGELIPSSGEHSNIFQGGILLVILGSLLLEDKFTTPIDALVNGLTGAISLITNPTRSLSWWIVFGYCVFVFLAALISTAIGPKNNPDTFLGHLDNWTYHICKYFGKATVLFSFVFLYSVFSFYSIQSREAALLVLFWGIYIALCPLRIANLLQALFDRHKDPFVEMGDVIRIEHPNLAIVELLNKTRWTDQDVYQTNLADGKTHSLLPIFYHYQNDRKIGTALLLDEEVNPSKTYPLGKVFLDETITVKRDRLLENQYGCEILSDPIGTIVEGTNIAKIRFEVWQNQCVSKGVLVFCIEQGERVYYQILDGLTKTENLTNNERGFTIVEAIQLGTWDETRGFQKYKWLPRINSLVFKYTSPPKFKENNFLESQSILGCIPYSDFPVGFDIEKLRSHHLAILGTTGKGKTELAITLIERALESEIKVFIVDLTLMLAPRLANENPQKLNLDAKQISDLNNCIQAVETGPYSKSEEKKALNNHLEGLNTTVSGLVSALLTSTQTNLGILELDSITNNEATVRLIELFLSNIFEYYRRNLPSTPIWIILEEAHTIVPETKTMGISDYSSQAAIIGKISQIALQGRKYNVGLMILAQRTANVSKTVLTQCNSIISFAQYDRTGLEFLDNFLGDEYAKTVPNLEFLEAVAYGYGVKSDRPVIVKIHEKTKDEMSNKIVDTTDIDGSDDIPF